MSDNRPSVPHHVVSEPYVCAFLCTQECILLKHCACQIFSQSCSASEAWWFSGRVRIAPPWAGVFAIQSAPYQIRSAEASPKVVI